jgi:hypothetical protein
MQRSLRVGWCSIFIFVHPHLACISPSPFDILLSNDAKRLGLLRHWEQIGDALGMHHTTYYCRVFAGKAETSIKTSWLLTAYQLSPSSIDIIHRDGCGEYTA